MSTDGGRSLPRRPARYGPDALEAHGGTLPGPAEITEVAHQTAAILVGTGRAAHDPEVTSRLVTIVDDLGLSTVADLWSARPARSLPGSLWRLYALREWVRRSPRLESRIASTSRDRSGASGSAPRQLAATSAPSLLSSRSDSGSE